MLLGEQLFSIVNCLPFFKMKSITEFLQNQQGYFSKKKPQRNAAAQVQNFYTFR